MCINYVRGISLTHPFSRRLFMSDEIRFVVEDEDAAAANAATADLVEML